MAWEENPRICLHMQLIAILSRTEVKYEKEPSVIGHHATAVPFLLRTILPVGAGDGRDGNLYPRRTTMSVSRW